MKKMVGAAAAGVRHRRRAKRSMMLLSLLALAAPAAAQGGWTGAYAYEESLGRDGMGQGAAISVTHRLTIGPASCRLRAVGYQTDTTIICRARPQGRDRLQVSFVSHGDGRAVNQYGVARYKPGQPLLTLSRASGRVLTTWQGYGLDDDGVQQGVFLRRL